MSLKTVDEKKADAELDMPASTTLKLQAEAQKILAESRWYPFVVLAGVFGAAIALVKLMH
ncbi:MAG TPA: hypothetical protein VFM22_05490 [Castellaniella sp.]|jgi:hypothetical protein|nr:hypothetical protein [Castellaniella sp.]